MNDQELREVFDYHDGKERLVDVFFTIYKSCHCQPSEKNRKKDLRD